MNVDAIKCGGGGGYNLDALGGNNPFGAPPPKAEAAADGPLEETLVSRNWKVRNAAYQKLTKEFKMADDEKSAVFSKYTSFFKKMCLDTNPAAQAEATEAIKIFVDRAAISKKHADDILPHLVKKAFASNKAQTKTNTQEIFLLFFELGANEEAMKNLLVGMKNPNFKVVIAALNITIQAMKDFGPRQVEYNKLSKAFPVMFNHKKGEVRELVQNLAVETYGFVGDIFHEQVKNYKGMRPATLDALAKAFGNVTGGSSTPARGLRSEQKAASKGAASQAKKAKAKAAADDPFSFIEAVDVTKELSKNWLTEVMAPKWKDKKAKLEELLKLCEAPKIKYVPMFSDITKNLKKLLKDSNIIVRSFSIKCLEKLAKGLRKEFRGDAASVLENLLPWYKEKKMSVLQPLNNCMDAFEKHCLGWKELSDPVLTAFKNKVPQVRKNTLDFTIRAIKSDHIDLGDLKKNIFKPLIAACMTLSGDRDKTVRQSAIECIANLVIAFGDRAMYPTLAKIENSDAKKHKMITDLVTELKAKLGDAGGGAPSTAAAVAEPPKKTASAKPKASPKKPPKSPTKKRLVKPEEDEEEEEEEEKMPKPKPRRAKGRTKSKSPTRKGRSKSPAKGGRKGKASKSASGRGGSSKSGGSKTVSIPSAKLIEHADAKERLGDLFGAANINALESKKWKERLASVDHIIGVVKENMDGAIPMVGAIFSLFNTKPGWKDTNFQVCKKVFEATKILVAGCPEDATKGLCVVPMEELLNKMSDRKIETECKDYLTACSEAQGPRFVFTVCKDKLKKVRNPKAIAGYILWVVQSLKEFGAGSTDVQEMISYGKEWIAHPHKDVRANAIKVLVEIYKQTGKILVEKMLEGLKSSVADDLQKQFNKIPDEQLGKIEATRAVKGKKVVQEVKMDDIVPRVDISSQVNDKILTKMGDKQWKLRKEAMEDIEQIVKGANCRIKGKDGGLFSTLKHRLADKNKNLVVQALKLVALLIESMGSGSGKYLGAFMDQMLTCFADRKPTVREEAVRTLIACIKSAGLSKLIAYIPKGLEQTNARKDILAALNPALEEQKLKKSEMKELVMPILKCNIDRTKEVRTLAEATLKKVVEVVGFKHVNSKLASFKKAEKLQLDPILQKFSGDLLSDAPAETAPAPSKKGKEKATSSSASKHTPSKKRGATSDAKSSKASAASSSAGEEILDCIHKSTSREKEKRAKRDARRMKGKCELDPNEIEDLKEGLAKYTSADFHKQMMHKNFPEFSKAISKIEKAIGTDDNPKVFERVVGILDLLLKWVAFRLCDGKVNTKVLKILLKFLQTLTTALDENEYELLEGEAKNLLPYLLEKVSGHSMAPMRDACHQIVQRLCNIYPASRILQELSDAMESKSKRVQAECLMEIGNMVERFGVNVAANPKKTVMMMGTCVGTSDKGLREAALVALSKVYQAINCDRDKIWKFFGGRGTSCKLPKKNITMITERLKRIKPLPVQEPAQDEEKVPSDSIQEQEDEHLDVHHHQGDEADQELTASQGGVPPHQESMRSRDPAQPQTINDQPQVEQTIDFGQLGVPSNAFTLGDFTLGGISGGDDGSIGGGHGMGISEDVGSFGGNAVGMGQATYSSPARQPIHSQNGYGAAESPAQTGNKPPHKDVIALEKKGVEERVEALRQIWLKVQEEGAMIYANDADVLVERVAAQIAPPYQMRLCKYALNTLMEFWQNLDFAAIVSYETLRSMTRTFLLTLLDQNLRDTESGDKVMKALNVLTLKVLENAQRTDAFGCLLDLLSESVKSKETGQFPDLVVKCILKLTKVLPQTIGDINLRALVESIHGFLSENPPTYSFPDPSDNRLRTVRRLIEEITNLRGREMQNLAVSVSGSPSAPIVRYVEEVFGITGAPGSPPGGSEINRQHYYDSYDNYPSRPVGAILPTEVSSDPRSTQVAMMYKRLHMTDQAKQALEELYEFTKTNKDYDITPHMNMVSRPFQSWIQRGFKRIEERKNRPQNTESSASHFQERLRSLRARAAQIRGGSFGALSYGKSPPRSQMVKENAPATSSNISSSATSFDPSSFSKRLEAISAKAKESKGVRAAPASALSAPASNKSVDLSSLRSRLNGLHSMRDAQKKENTGPSISNRTAPAPKLSGAASGLDSIRARLEEMRRH